jgi:hypothetical protein
MQRPILGRPIKHWSFQELNEKADLVIIGKAVSTKDSKNWVYDNPTDTTWVNVDTVFKVSTVLKGKLKNKKNEVSLRHYRFYNAKGELIIGGPSFVEFYGKLNHTYLIFLKKNEIGQYEPLTGQYDPYQSFWLLDRYHITKERDKAKKISKSKAK